MYVLTQFPAMTLGFPDVCLTVEGPAVVPVPYPNAALESTGFPAVYNIFIGGAPAHNLATILMCSTGDLPGIAGVASGTVMGPARTIYGCANTLLMGAMPAKRVTCGGLTNTINAPCVAVEPNQFVVLALAA